MQMAAGIVPDDWETLNRATYPKQVGALAAPKEIKPAADNGGGVTASTEHEVVEK